MTAAVWIVFIVIGLPILGGLFFAAWREWLRYRYKVGSVLPPEELHQLQRTVEKLQAEQERLRRRVENLETIVASTAWDALASKLGLEESPPSSLPDEKTAPSKSLS
ncbi:MAG: hypothetical protein KatS3mg026_0535 [Bacteroidia bacterium]|nr:MAG: hypothetical protein KatS3mg026_0535 [Bacteroidia bacterium]